MGILFLAIAGATLYCIIGAATQHVWGPWVDRITAGKHEGDEHDR